MKTVTLTDLRRNLENYLDEAKNGEIVITRYGKQVGRLIAVTGDEQATTEQTAVDENSVASAA